jgi:NADPH2:quinone reductase
MLRALMAGLANLCAHGKISGHVHAVYPLDQAAAALKAIASRAVMGKVILRP